MVCRPSNLSTTQSETVVLHKPRHQASEANISQGPNYRAQSGKLPHWA